MKFHLAFLMVVAYITTSSLYALPSEKTSDSITVYIFLNESCVISQYYTLPLRHLHQEYANDSIQFLGVFPNLSSRPKHIQTFKETYNIPFELRGDYAHKKKELLGATVTPEVIVYNESSKQILYQGRIDDAYARIGQRKQLITSSELKDVLEAISLNQPIHMANTQAVGCFIEKNKYKQN